MKYEAIATAISKGLAAGSTATVSVGLLTLTPWTWAAALIGAAASYYFEPEQTPETLKRILFGILAMGFAGALMGAALPHAPFMAWTSNVDVTVRAGLCALMVRFLYSQGKRLMSGWKRTDGGS